MNGFYRRHITRVYVFNDAITPWFLILIAGNRYTAASPQSIFDTDVQSWLKMGLFGRLMDILILGILIIPAFFLSYPGTFILSRGNSVTWGDFVGELLAPVLQIIATCCLLVWLSRIGWLLHHLRTPIWSEAENRRRIKQYS